MKNVEYTFEGHCSGVAAAFTPTPLHFISNANLLQLTEMDVHTVSILLWLHKLFSSVYVQLLGVLMTSLQGQRKFFQSYWIESIFYYFTFEMVLNSLFDLSVLILKVSRLKWQRNSAGTNSWGAQVLFPLHLVFNSVFFSIVGLDKSPKLNAWTHFRVVCGSYSLLLHSLLQWLVYCAKAMVLCGHIESESIPSRLKLTDSCILPSRIYVCRPLQPGSWVWSSKMNKCQLGAA